MIFILTSYGESFNMNTKTFFKLGEAMPRATYKTKQQDEIKAYLAKMPGAHVTAAAVCEHFKEQGVNIGISTVYRQLDRLVDQGIVAKYTIDGSSGACYEFLGKDAHRGELCFHCKCESCGKLIHLQCHELASLGRHLLTGHGFSVNPYRTVFYGLCAACSEKAEKEETVKNNLSPEGEIH